MALDDLDRDLARLRAATESITANLVELEREPNLVLLDHAPLRGETATRWADAKSALADVWRWRATLNGLLEEATRLRGTRRTVTSHIEGDLADLLHGPSVELTNADVPLPERHLLSAGTTTARCTPDELLEVMAEAFGRTTTVVAAAGGAWDTLVPRVAAIQTTLATATQLAGALDDEAIPELELLRPRMMELAERLLEDPLSVSGTDIDAAEAEVAAFGNSLDAAVRLRDGFDREVTRAQVVLEDARAAVCSAEESHREVGAKIITSNLPTPPGLDEVDLDGWHHVLMLAEQQQWRVAHAALTEWTARADDLVRRAHSCSAGCRAALAERDQLRGLLDAYRAKSGSLGLAEDPELAVAYERAHAVLFAAPTDLEEANQLIRRYHQTIPERASSKDDRR